MKMNRTDYITLRNQNRVHEIAFNYYKEKGGKVDFDNFMKSGLFNSVNLEELFQELDIKYEVTLLFYNDKLIKLQD